MEIVRGVTSISPPAPEEDNPMELSEAVSVVNQVLTTQFRAFDKLRQVLTLMQDGEAVKAKQQVVLDDLNGQIDQAKKSLAGYKGQINSAQKALEQAATAFEEQKQAAADAIAQQQFEFNVSLTQRQIDFDAQLKQQAAEAQVHLEENLAGLKRDIAQLQDKKDELDQVIQAVKDKQAELAAAEDKLSATTKALEQLKARL